MNRLLMPDTQQLSFFDAEDIATVELGLFTPPAVYRDFRITDEHSVGRGSLREKAAANLAAIRALNTIEREHRPATADEQAVLVRYSGWGALANWFHSFPPQEFRALAAELREILTDDEYTSARATTPNAHYTSPEVISAIWYGLSRLGLTSGAQILEPAAGIGHFFGLMPEPIFTRSRRTGVEIDSLSARIARLLYPDSIIHHAPFESVALPADFFDVVLGNVPFGNYGVFDSAYRRQPHLTRSIHDYFFAKSLAKTRPGGLLALISSRYTMDKQDSSVRRHLGETADLLGAVRLPNTTFQANAGTSVTADILFLRKREATARPTGHAWQDLRPIETEDGPASVNEYFAAHPEMMLGEPALEHGQYGREFALLGTFDPAALKRALDCLPFDVYRPRTAGTPSITTIPESCEGVKDGAYVEHEGRLYIRQGATFEPAQVSPAIATRIRRLMELRDAVREVLRTQLADLTDTVILAAREDLNRVYDSFVADYGPVSNRENRRAYTSDQDQPLLLSLETYDPETNTPTRAPIFERRTIEQYRPAEHADSAEAALLIALNETGRVDWARMEQLTGQTQEQALTDLGTLVYRNPEGGNWETADSYLSGNVRAKLAAAQAAATIDPTYQRNIEALTAVQPADLEPAEIEARLGATWVPPRDIAAFIAELLDVPADSVTVHHAAAIATWTVELDYRAKYQVSNTTTYGSARFTAGALIDQGLNGRTPTAYDEHEDGTRTINQPETLAAREKLYQIAERFRTWVWEDAARAARLARAYNDQFNNIRLRQFDGSHLTLPGMVRACLRDADLSPHQKNGVWRILQTRNTLLAHVVGAGKSWTMAAAAMELRRLGLARKPMFVVPNHLVEQWGAEFLRLYPQANLFIAGKDHFTAGNRQRAMARIASGNYDAVIVSHRSFEFLPVSDEWFEDFVQSQLDELEAAIREAKADQGDNRRIVKELEKAKKRLEAKLRKRAAREQKDNTLIFEELGIDQLFVDEADLYKNLAYITKMNRIAGLPNSDSQRAFDLYIKIAYLRQRTARGVVFATGTPISNTLAEMYTMLRYLAPELLTERNVDHFDAWAKNFGEAVTALELAPDGSGYRMHTRFAKFINLPELLSMFRTVADVQTADMINLPRPTLTGGRPVAIAAPATPALKQYVTTLTERAEKLRTERIDPHVDNMLRITTDGRKAALDMRLIDPTNEDDPTTKVNRAVHQLYSIWDRTRDQRLTQLFFVDFSTPDPVRFNIYHDVRTKLVDRGIPESEIAFIHDADTDVQKKTLFDAVNAGRVRILAGSTEKLGAGTNVQTRLIALHHLDAPWRPRDIEQREGRILRQGNLNPEVTIYRYVTEGSFDAYMWQTLETKARFIAQVMSGQTSVRCAEDLENGALTYAEIKALASGNPAVVEKVKVDTEIRKLDQLRAVHQNDQYKIRWQIRELPSRIAQVSRALENAKSDIATRNYNTSEEFTMTVGNKIFAGKGAREEAAKALNAAIISWKADTTTQLRATFKGFRILSRGAACQDELPTIYIEGAGRYAANLNASNAIGTIQSIEHTIRNLEQVAETYEYDFEKLSKTLTDYHAQAERPFDHEARLTELLARQAELNSALDLDKGDQQAAPAAEHGEEEAA